MKKHIVKPGGVTEECDDLSSWALWFEVSGDLPFRKGGRRVAETVAGDTRVSTVFLGVGHLFETMVFGGPHDEFLVRCDTYGGSLAEHARTVAMCLIPPPGGCHV